VTRTEIDDLEADLDYQRQLRAAILEAQEIDKALQETQINTLQGAIAAMTRNLEIARENLANLAVTAPVSGQLSVFEANVGESKGIGQRIGQIEQLHTFKVKAFVDEFYLTSIASGQPATVDIDGQVSRLEIVKVYPDVRDRLVEIDLEFAGKSPSLIRRGQTLRMRLDIGQPAETLVLDNGAFFDDTGGGWVFLLDDSGNMAKRQPVLLGRRSPEAIEVLDGLEAGDRVITSAYAQFLDSDRLVLDTEE
jgi:HlyD family secretion protein